MSGRDSLWPAVLSISIFNYIAVSGISLIMFQRLLTIMVISASSGMSRGDDTTSAPQCINGPEDRQCWAGPWGTFDINTDYYENTPDTGRIVEVKTVLCTPAYK